MTSPRARLHPKTVQPKPWARPPWTDVNATVCQCKIVDLHRSSNSSASQAVQVNDRVGPKEFVSVCHSLSIVGRQSYLLSHCCRSCYGVRGWALAFWQLWQGWSSRSAQWNALGICVQSRGVSGRHHQGRSAEPKRLLMRVCICVCVCFFFQVQNVQTTGYTSNFPPCVVAPPKVLEQTGGNRFNGPIDCFLKTAAESGVLSLYRGLAAPLLGSMAECASLFTSYGYMKRLLGVNEEVGGVYCYLECNQLPA